MDRSGTPHFKGYVRTRIPKRWCAKSQHPDLKNLKQNRSDHADSRVLKRSFRTASFGDLTPRCNHSRTLVTGSVCVTELRTSTSNWINPPGSRSCLRNAHNPKTDASYNPSASTSTE